MSAAGLLGPDLVLNYCVVNPYTPFFTIGKAAWSSNGFWDDKNFWEQRIHSKGVSILGMEDQPILCTQNFGGRGSVVMTTV